MTLETRLLDDISLRRSQALHLYRLTRTKYVTLSGAGSAARPGRWNRLGEEAIYTSLEIGTTLVERLVHTPKDLIPNNLSLMTINLSGNWLRDDPFYAKDEKTGALMGIFPSLRHAGELAHRSPSVGHAKSIQMPFAIAVPSVIVPVWNMVLFPRRHGFESHVSLGHDEPFELDSRLFPDHATGELAP